MDQEFEYDIFVIGGGSGGLSCSKAAAALGKRVAMADFVKPSPVGSKWGLGGTCVNVGCIPKKLMHFTALLGEMKKDQVACGWNVDENATHNWQQMVGSVQMHIKKLNFGYRSSMQQNNVKYFNALASLQDQHTIKLVDKDGKEQFKTAKYIVIAVGGRPLIPDELQHLQQFIYTSDDIFSLKQAPGKTLVIGASYVALECAGFLTALGLDTTVMVRSILLRGFDQDIANRIKKYMQTNHTKFIDESVPTGGEKLENGQIRVYFKKTNDTEGKNISFADYDSILVATGRYPDTKSMGLDKLNIKLDRSGKIVTNNLEQTNVDNIYAIGDCQSGRMELTPPAIMAGSFLAKRLFGGSNQIMNYNNIATTVFTPIEYGAIGLSEEDAYNKYGEDNVDCYHTHFKPLEWNFLSDHTDDSCYVKVLVNKLDKDRVVGFHYLGPNAGEVTQGYSVAFNMGATKDDFFNCIGIHPTCSEEIVNLTITKKEDADATKHGC